MASAAFDPSELLRFCMFCLERHGVMEDAHIYQNTMSDAYWLYWGAPDDAANNCIQVLTMDEVKLHPPGGALGSIIRLRIDAYFNDKPGKQPSKLAELNDLHDAESFIENISK